MLEMQVKDAGRITEDREEILSLIDAETAAYFEKNFSAWEKCWVHEAYVRRFAWFARGGMKLNVSWEQESSEQRRSMAAYPTPNRSMQQLKRENINIRIGRDIAWVTFDQTAPATGDPFDVVGLQHELRILERVDGGWKIVCCGELQPIRDSVTSPLLQVDENSTVLWQNKACTRVLWSNPLLAMRGKRLRATDRGSDERLKAAISWAARANDYATRMATTTSIASGHMAAPVLLTDSLNELVSVCWVSAQCNMILVSLQDQDYSRNTVASAATAYGLTPAQARLASLIIDGKDLVEAAAVLGISINTARTQLKRMFKKTGTHSQLTLVRAILEAAAPPL
jgi:DNA-binding CsgD family transcriptional regulator